MTSSLELLKAKAGVKHPERLSSLFRSAMCRATSAIMAAVAVYPGCPVPESTHEAVRPFAATALASTSHAHSVR